MTCSLVNHYAKQFIPLVGAKDFNFLLLYLYAVAEISCDFLNYILYISVIQYEINNKCGYYSNNNSC